MVLVDWTDILRIIFLFIKKKQTNKLGICSPVPFCLHGNIKRLHFPDSFVVKITWLGWDQENMDGSDVCCFQAQNVLPNSPPNPQAFLPNLPIYDNSLTLKPQHDTDIRCKQLAWAHERQTSDLPQTSMWVTNKLF